MSLSDVPATTWHVCLRGKTGSSRLWVETSLFDISENSPWAAETDMLCCGFRRIHLPITDRRTLLQTAVAIPLTAVSTKVVFAQTSGEPSAALAKSAPSKDVTRTLAHYLVTANYEDLPANVRKEGVRTLLNWVGVAIGGSHHQTVDIAVAALAPFSGPAQASL